MICRLLFASGPRAGEVVNVEKLPFWLGRDPRCDLAFDPEVDLTVSGFHARLDRTEAGEISVTDSSTNGTLINGAAVKSAVLSDGDTLELGAGGPRLTCALAAEARPPEPAPRTEVGGKPQAPSARGGMKSTETVAGIEDDGAVWQLDLSLERDPGGEQLTFSQPVIRLGRGPESDLAFDAQSDLLVSFSHAKIMALEGRAVLFDSDSTNGTFVDGKQVVRHDLAAGEVIELGLGGPRLKVASVRLQQVTNRSTMRATQEQQGSTVFASAGGELVDLSLGQAQLLGEHQLGDRLTLGRAGDNDIVLDSLFVSSHHAVVERHAGDRVRLRDLGSANGTYLAGDPVSSAELAPGTELAIGPYLLKYSGRSLLVFDARTRTWIDAHGLTRVDARTGRAFLDRVSLRIQPGEFVCVLGPSGCGKSTLVRAVAGSSPADEGKVLLNGIDFYEHHEQLKHQVAYVPQDDIIHPHLTVWRTLHHAARLRLPRGTSRADRRARMEDVLGVLELYDHRDKPIHKLSGGQRKRVSIAVELLTDPAVIFLDEPTSGLDPNLEEKMMLLFREMTLKGKTVVAVTHTLDNIHLADKVLFMVDGKLAFFGSPEEGRAFFEVERLPEVYKRFDERRGDLEALRSEYEASEIFHRHVASQLPGRATSQAPPRKPPRRNRGRPGPLRQLAFLTGRYLELITRDLRNTAILLLQAPLVAMFILLAMRTDQPDRGPTSTMFLIMSLSALWFGCSNAAREISKEGSIFARERMVNLGVVPYVASKFLVLQLLSLLQVTAMLLLVHWLRGGYVLTEPPPACARWGIEACSALILPGVPGNLWLHLLNLYLTAVGGVGLGLLISALAGNSDKAMSLVPLVLIPQVLFSGSFGVPAPDEHVKRSVGYAMALNWSLDQAKRVAMCTPAQEKPRSAPGKGCADCLHGYDPFRHRRLKQEAQDDDSRCLAVLPVVAQMTDFPESVQVVEDGLYTPPSTHGKGKARDAHHSRIGLYVQATYNLILLVLVCVALRFRERRV